MIMMELIKDKFILVMLFDTLFELFDAQHFVDVTQGEGWVDPRCVREEVHPIYV